MLVTVEAKGPKDDILPTQLRQQVVALQAMPAVSRALQALGADPSTVQVVPLALKVLGRGAVKSMPATLLSGVREHATVLYVAEYEPVLFTAAVLDAVSLRRETILAVRPALDSA